MKTFSLSHKILILFHKFLSWLSSAAQMFWVYKINSSETKQVHLPIFVKSFIERNKSYCFILPEVKWFLLHCKSCETDILDDHTQLYNESHTCISHPIKRQQSEFRVPTDLISSEMIAIEMQQLGDFLHIDSIVERRSITNFPLVSWDFALEALD